MTKSLQLHAVWSFISFILVTALSGCVSPSPVRPGRPLASHNLHITPTLIEPRVTANNRDHWYQDGYTNSTQMAINFGGTLTFDELQSLRTSHPEIVSLVELSDMPILRDVALMAHLAGIIDPNDAGAKPLLADLEAQGHRLAMAARMDPAIAQWIDHNLQAKKPAINAMASRAAKGDPQALQQLMQFAERVRQSSLAAPTAAAIHSLTAAQHYYRSRPEFRASYDTSVYEAFDVLRRFSYRDALNSQATTAAAQRMVTEAASGGLFPSGGPPNAQAGCFAINGNAWDELEIKSYRAACMPGSKEANELLPLPERVCTSQDSADSMNRQLNLPRYKEIVAKKAQDIYGLSHLKLSGPMRAQAVETSGASDDGPDDQAFNCDVIFDFENADTSEMDMHFRGFYKALVAKNATARFRSKLDSHGNRVLELTDLMGTPVGGAAASAPSAAARIENSPSPAAASPSSKGAPQWDQDFDKAFLKWQQTWAVDRYTPGSAHGESSNCTGQNCAVDGHFSFIRGSEGHTVPFKATVLVGTQSGISVTRLCYLDTSSGFPASDCAP